MGYDITMLVGKAHHGTKHAGITEVWFELNVSLDLCVLGSKSDALNTLVWEAQAKAKENETTVHYFFGHTDGNTQVKLDRYDDPLWPVPIKEVLAAINALSAECMEYRRLKWAKALLESMADDSQGLEVMFYGH